ncbi:MAG TPA: hypothetical protein VED87_08640 [Methylocystis sp.]|nr:hypothetical protein [Methylocystis sp.]
MVTDDSDARDEHEHEAEPPLAEAPVGPPPPKKKRGGFFRGLFSLLFVLVLLLVAGGGAAILLKDSDPRARAVVDFVEAAAKDPAGAASTASAEVEGLVKELSGLVGDKLAQKPAAGENSTPAQTSASDSAEPERHAAQEAAAPPAPAPPPQRLAEAPAPSTPSVEAKSVAAPEELNALRREIAAATQNSREALAAAREALEAAKEAQRAAARAGETAEKPAGAPLEAPAEGNELKDNVSALEGRIDYLGEELKKLSQRIDQPKSEARAETEAPQSVKASPTQQIAGVETLALSQLLFDSVRHGRPFAAEAAALAERGADPGLLRLLEPFAQTGAPTTAKLVAEFAPIAQRLQSQENQPPPNESFGQGVQRVLGGLAHVHSSGQKPDAASLNGRILEVELALAHDDAQVAAAAFAQLPADASGKEFGAKLDALAAARKAAVGLVDAAVAGLGHIKN